MTISLEITQDQKKWSELLTRASYRTIFHEWNWLKIVEKHTKTKLYPIIGLKGTNPIGIIPLFYQKKGFLKLILSPPSKTGLIYLGPLIIDYENMKQGKKESIFFEFLKAVDKFIFSELKGNYVLIHSPPGLLDSRPFKWNAYKIDPRYTLILDLNQSLDTIWKNFDGKLRVHIDKSSNEGISVQQGSIEDLDFLLDSVLRRMTEQGLVSNLSKPYLHEIFESFFPKNLKIFIAKYQGDKVGGSVLLHYDNKISLWIGTPKISLKGLAPNDVVQWETIKWAKENDFQYYEIMDAGENQRLSDYKSKFNPSPSIWFSAKKYSSSMAWIAEKLYRLIKKR